jgi:predicted enzyme related to lactoylglutathione lyase
MPEITKAAAGTFCWIELGTTDPAAAKKFYGGLFDWTITDVPMGGMTYGLAALGDKQIGGITLLSEEAKKMGAPPNWLSYVAVDDAAASGKKIASLGGKVLVGPLDIGQGHMAVAADPTGAVFAVWQSVQSMGTWLMGEPGSLGWNELISNNEDKAVSFYKDLFGWKAEKSEMPGMTYTILKQGETMVGGSMAQPKQMAGAPSLWGVYFSVADADQAAEKVTALGGKVLNPPMDIPNIGRFAVVADPQGAVFSVMKFLPPQK